MKNQFAKLSSLSVAVLSGFLGSPAAVMAQDGQSANAAGGLEEIIVTARKRTESIQEIPMSVEVFSRERLYELNTRDLTQITRFTPGLSYEQTTANFSYRFLPQLRFRGMTTNNSTPNAQVGAVFEDGIFVVGGAQSMTTHDVERIEVMKGPQNAYFGRNTLGGAINFITRTPSNTFKAEVGAEAETRESHRFNGSMEGPIVLDKVAGRIAAEHWREGAHFKSRDGGDLGRQETSSVTATLNFTPNDAFRVKLRGHYQEDSDFGNANFLFRAQGDFANCRPAVTPWYCGALPKMGDAVTLQNGTQRIVPFDSWMDTNITPANFVTLGRGNALQNFLQNTSGVMNDIPFFNKLPSLDHFGSERRIYRLSGSWGYDFADGYAIEGNASHGDMRFAGLWDSDNVFGVLPGTGTRQYVYQPYLTSDTSAEVRLTSPQNQTLRWLGGVNYFSQSLDGALGASQKSVNEITGLENTNVFQNTDRDRSKVVGLFAAASYDILDTLTFDIEGRYQVDKLKAFQQTGVNRFDPIFRTFKNFLPRAILSYKPNADTNIYANWSRGALPGVANATFATLVNQVAAVPTNPLGTTDKDQIRSLLSGIVRVDTPLTLAAEKVDQFELGWKQEFLDGRGYASLAGYYIRWKNMKVAVAATNLSNAVLSNGRVLPANGDINGDGVSDSVRAIAAGQSRIYGLEFDSSLRLIPELSINLNGELVNSRYNASFPSGATTTNYSGVTDLNGKRLALYPLYKGSLTARWEDDLASDWSYYVQTTASLTGKMFVDPAELTYVSSFWLVNGSVGVQKDGVLVELYGKNLTDYAGWTTGRMNGSVDGTQTVAAVPARKQTWGIRTKLSF